MKKVMNKASEIDAEQPDGCTKLRSGLHLKDLLELRGSTKFAIGREPGD